MEWSQINIQNHLKACVILDKIKDNSFEFIKNNPNTNEFEVQQFINGEFKKNNLIADIPDHEMIVGFNDSSSSPHYYPNKNNSKKLEPNALILIDIWARLNQEQSPYSDITWMAYCGNEVPDEIQKVWDIVKDARDSCIKFIQFNLKSSNYPTGKEVDDIARKVIINAGYEKNILHTTGHSIGFDSPHGKEDGISQKNPNKIIKNLSYTIEPGIYLKDKFGIRSEIDFYINDNLAVVVTTPIQKEIIIIPINITALSRV